MRIGIVSDIHANLPALQAALTVLEREAVDIYLCPGDIVGYGPWPNECVERVAALGAVCVAGNHDLVATKRLPPDRCDRLAQKTLRWTAEVLTDDSRGYLAGLPARWSRDDLMMTHGSLRGPEEYVTAPRARQELTRLEGVLPGVNLLLLGHTHRSLAYGTRTGVQLEGRDGSIRLDPHERYVLNPGSVGQARERAVVARFMILDLEQRRAIFHAVSYEHSRCRQTLRAHRLPPRAYHSNPAGLRARGRAARRWIRRTVGRARRTHRIRP